MVKKTILDNPKRFIVKCDVCKKTIKQNVTMVVSAMGARCLICGRKGL
jgi:hypothetical protein